MTDRINIIGKLLYVWTDASEGVPASQLGWQDVTIAAKIRAFSNDVSGMGQLNLFGAGVFSTPMRNYTPDFLPVSIGSHSLTRGLRSTVNFDTKMGFFFSGTGQYTWREHVTLNRGLLHEHTVYFTRATYRCLT